jgi:hypothetical protein
MKQQNQPLPCFDDLICDYFRHFSNAGVEPSRTKWTNGEKVEPLEFDVACHGRGVAGSAAVCAASQGEFPNEHG